MTARDAAREPERAASYPVVVVASYLPGETPFKSSRYEVRPVECVSVFDYSAGLAAAWATDQTVVNVEHDLEVTDDLIAGLVDCPHPLCAQTYPIHASPDGVPFYPYTATQPGPWIDYGAVSASWAAPGFIKVSAAARFGPFPAEKHWLSVEMATNYYVAGRWHLHWPPVEHYHQ